MKSSPPARKTERQRAIERGLEFIYQTARDSKNFEWWGHDYLGCFYCTWLTSKNVKLRRTARRMGQERARYWRRKHARITPDLEAEDIWALVFGGYAADGLGVRDPAFKEKVRAAAARFTARDYFGFDTAHEPPPGDVPDECACGVYNERGRKTCSECKRRLVMFSPYAVWMDALTGSYHGERYGVRLGASYAEVIKWLPTMRRYPTYDGGDSSDFYWALYAVTHIVYTLNDYSFYRLSPRSLPEEYAFLKLNLRNFIAMEDAESVGELLDTLQAFGLSEDHQLIRKGRDYLLASQNPDGSWGDMGAEDIYRRYHPTWTAIDGLREYTWRGGLRRSHTVKRLLKGTGK